MSGKVTVGTNPAIQGGMNSEHATDAELDQAHQQLIDSLAEVGNVDNVYILHTPLPSEDE